MMQFKSQKKLKYQKCHLLKINRTNYDTPSMGHSSKYNSFVGWQNFLSKNLSYQNLHLSNPEHAGWLVNHSMGHKSSHRVILDLEKFRPFKTPFYGTFDRQWFHMQTILLIVNQHPKIPKFSIFLNQQPIYMSCRLVRVTKSVLKIHNFAFSWLAKYKVLQVIQYRETFYIIGDYLFILYLITY